MDLGQPSSPPEAVHSAAEFSSGAEFKSHLSRAISSATHFKELVYTNIPLSWAEIAIQADDEDSSRSAI
jgi:hypothetical protein